MSLAVHVKDGTGAGKRIIREPKTAWIHVCDSAPLDGGRILTGAYRRCPDCGQPRPS